MNCYTYVHLNNCFLRFLGSGSHSGEMSHSAHFLLVMLLLPPSASDFCTIRVCAFSINWLTGGLSFLCPLARYCAKYILTASWLNLSEYRYSTPSMDNKNLAISGKA